LQFGPWPWEAAAPAKSRRAGRAPGRGNGGARPWAHLGPGGDRCWGGEHAGMGAWRGPTEVAAVARGSDKGAHGWQCVTWGGATGPREPTHARGGSEARRGDGLPGGGHGGAVERRERGRRREKEGRALKYGRPDQW
jgi:hypothetical protein